MNEIAVHQPRAIAAAPDSLTAMQIRAQVNLIQEVMRDVMKEGTHFGKVPGCDKDSLFKPGAEKLASTFRLAIDPEVIDLSTPDEIRFRVRARVTSASGAFLGAGIGECSTGEEKYKWRRAVCDAEFEATPEDRRRLKYGRGRNNSFYTVMQIRTEPADLANTVLKMAKKRALVDAVLTVTAASDIFTQDIEDLPDELRGEFIDQEDGGPKPTVTKPTRRSEAGPKAPDEKKAPASDGSPVDAGMVRVITAQLARFAMTEADVVAKYGCRVAELPAAGINDVLEWIRARGAENAGA